MDDTIINIYCLYEEFLEAIEHRDDPESGSLSPRL
jgi:hypothetical protein